MEDWMSERAFARRQHCSHGAVGKAIASGRIPEGLIKRASNGHVVAIESIGAAAAWRLNTDPDQSARRGKGGAGAPVQTFAPAVNAKVTANAGDSDKVGRVLGVVFHNSLPAWAGLAVHRYQLTADLAIELYADLLTTMMHCAAEAVGAPDDFRVLFPPDLARLLHKQFRPELVEWVTAAAASYQSDGVSKEPGESLLG